MRYLKPYSTLIAGIAIGVFVVPMVRGRIAGAGA
jgi:hypothetical protein